MTRAISSPMTETVIDDADSVSADGGAVSADAGSASADAGHLSDLKPERSARQDQNRDAAARRREDVSRVSVVLRIVVERKWLDAPQENRDRAPKLDQFGSSENGRQRQGGAELSPRVAPSLVAFNSPRPRVAPPARPGS